MKKTMFRTLLLFLPVLFLSVAATHAQNLGTVRVEEIVTELADYKTIQQQLANIQKQYQDTVQALQQQLNQELQNFQNQQGVMTPEKKASEEQRLNEFYQKALDYQNTHLGPNGTVAQISDRLLQPLTEKVRGAIQAVAQQKKLLLVINEQGALYVDQSIDITLDVQLYLKNMR